MTRRLEAGPLLVTLGAVLLLVSLFLSWFTGEVTAWEAFEVWDLVLFVLALASIAAGLGLTTQDVDLVDRRFLPPGWRPSRSSSRRRSSTRRRPRRGRIPTPARGWRSAAALRDVPGRRAHVRPRARGADGGGARPAPARVRRRRARAGGPDDRVPRAGDVPDRKRLFARERSPSRSPSRRRATAETTPMKPKRAGRESSRRGEAGLMPVREVAFELECFEWADERLEVAGRWKGLAGRRLNRPVLTVETEGGRRKHLVAMPGGHIGAAEESWRAAFDWPGDPAEITGAELEVGGKHRRRPAAARPQAPPPAQALAADTGDEALRSEIAALRGQVERLRSELAGRERENMQLREQIDEDENGEPLVSQAGDATVEIQPLARAPERHGRARAARRRARPDARGAVDRGRAAACGARPDARRDRAAGGRANRAGATSTTCVRRSPMPPPRRRRSATATAPSSRRWRRSCGRSAPTVARLTAELAAGPEIPPPQTHSARRQPPWAVVQRPDADEPVDEDRFAAASRR